MTTIQIGLDEQNATKIDPGRSQVVITDIDRTVVLRSENGDDLYVRARAGGGFDVDYRNDGGDEGSRFYIGETQFKNATIRRPGEPGFDHGY